MDKYRIGNLSMNPKFPSTNVHLSNTRPLYTMGGTSHQQLGPQLFMNTPSVGTSTQFQFVPGARNFRTSTTSSKTIPQSMGIGMSFAPLFHTVKTFFVNLMKPKVDAEINNTVTYNTTARREYNSAPNIYMDFMSDSKCDLDKKSVVNLSNCEMLSKLSASTKSFSDHDLPVATSNKYNFIPKTQEPSCKMELNCTEEQSAAKVTKEEDCPTSVTSDLSRSTPSPVEMQQKSKKNRKRNKIPNMSAKPRWQCHEGMKAKRATIGVSACKRTTKLGKNKKEKQKHELTQTIHEDTETEIETMSADEWDEPMVFVSTVKKNQIDRLEDANPKSVSFCADDFPAMPTTRNDSTNIKHQTYEFPTSSFCSLKAFTKERQRQISECDSEDSYIVFDNDDKSIPSSIESTTPSICERIRNRLSGQRWQQQYQRQISESSDDDDYICFESEESDVDVDNNDDDEENNQTAYESDSESEIDDIISLGTNPPDSGFDEREKEESDKESESDRERKVHFDLKPDVHILRLWSFAYQQARKGQWEEFARDRFRFQDRIKRLESTLAPILDSAHREKIYNQRFHINADNVNCVRAIEN